MTTPQHLQYMLRLADNALILGQRNAEWCSHGPALEEDIALANISLDLIGQARLLYSHAATLDAQLNGTKKTEDDYAYFRTEREFANYTIVELPHYGPLAGTARTERDYAVTIVRNFLYSALMSHLWTALRSVDGRAARRDRREVAEGNALSPAPRGRLADPLRRRHRGIASARAGGARLPDAVHARVLQRR